MLTPVMTAELEWKLRVFHRLGYYPHPGQMLMHSRQERFLVVVCGRRWGKTTAAAAEVVAAMAQGNKRVWALAPNHSKAELVFRQAKWNIQRGLKMKLGKGSSNKEGVKKLVIEWDDKDGNEVSSFVETKSAENPDSLIGEGLDLLIIDEAARVPETLWERELRPSLIDRKGRAILITTPVGRNWIYDKFQLGQGGDPEWFSLRFSSSDNPHLEAKEIEQAKRETDELMFEQEYCANFAAVNNIVYRTFKPDINVIDYIPTQYLPTFVAVDFGLRAPAAIVWGQWDEMRRRAYFFKCIKQRELTLDKLAEKIKLTNAALGVKVSGYFCDPAGRVRESCGVSMVERLRAHHGLNFRYKLDTDSRSIRIGVEHITALLRDATGESHIFFDRKGCRDMLLDIEAYEYPEWRPGMPQVEEPMKDGEHDHTMDAMRYWCVNVIPIRKTFVNAASW